MNKKHLYTAFIGCAIALTAFPLNAKEDSATSVESKFICAVQDNIPTMFTSTPNEANPTPLISWHAEYLLPEQSGSEICQQTATRLQDAYGQDQAKYLKAENTAEGNLVCLVNAAEQN